jgi:hypothetical protein
VILSTSSEEMGKQVQLLLLNFGILSWRRPQKDGCWHVKTLGKSAALFKEEIGFGLQRKQEALRRYVEDREWFKEESLDDEIVSVEAIAGPQVVVATTRGKMLRFPVDDVPELAGVGRGVILMRPDKTDDRVVGKDLELDPQTGRTHGARLGAHRRECSNRSRRRTKL